MERNYHDDLEINEFDLVDEWKNQAGLYVSYATDGVDLQEDTDNKKDELDLKEAKTELDIRNGVYALAGDMKITDKAISALVTNDPDVIRLKEEYNELKKEVSLARKVEAGFYMRKESLENIVKLTGREQYSEPKDSTGYVDNEKENYVRGTMNNKLNNKYNKEEK